MGRGLGAYPRDVEPDLILTEPRVVHYVYSVGEVLFTISSRTGWLGPESRVRVARGVDELAVLAICSQTIPCPPWEKNELAKKLLIRMAELLGIEPMNDIKKLGLIVSDAIDSYHAIKVCRSLMEEETHEENPW